MISTAGVMGMYSKPISVKNESKLFSWTNNTYATTKTDETVKLLKN